MKVKSLIKVLRNCEVSIVNGYENRLANVKVDENGEIWAYECRADYELHEADIIHHIGVYVDTDDEVSYIVVVRD